MNKREKAIWNLVIGVSAILLIIFINNILIGFFSSKGSSYNQITEKNNEKSIIAKVKEEKSGGEYELQLTLLYKEKTPY